MRTIAVASLLLIASTAAALAEPRSFDPSSGSFSPAAPEAEPRAIVSRSGKVVFNISLLHKSTVTYTRVPSCTASILHYGGESYYELKASPAVRASSGYKCTITVFYFWPKASTVSMLTPAVRYGFNKDNWPDDEGGTTQPGGITYGSRTLPDIPVPANGGTATVDVTFHY